MKNLTYQAYIDNSAVRDQLEREVRELRARTMQATFAASFRAIAAIFRRTHVLNFRTA
jgi:hypothetical protein